MARPEFIPPAWMEGQDSVTIHKRMMDSLPEDIDSTQGGFAWDFTKPTANEKSELIEFVLMEAIKGMHPQWANDTDLDLYATEVGLTRKEPNQATGTVHINGITGTTIPAGFVFAVPATGGTPAVEYETIGGTDIDQSGEADIPVRAIIPGTGGNVAANSIAIMKTPIKGITEITNPAPITGGTEGETDDELWQRIDDRNAGAGESFVGNDSDYKRWAEEVPGVGTALVIQEWQGPGTVKIVLLDSNGEAANPTIVGEVYDYIVSPGDRIKRKAPIGATVTVDRPNELNIDYEFTLQLESGYDPGVITAAFKAAMLKYYAEAKEEDTVRYTRVAAVLTGIEGVIDHSDLTLNSSTSNISIGNDEYPVTGSVTAN